jgi:hypothetical protein
MPTKQPFDQLIKECQLAMHSAVILARENHEFRAANEKQLQNAKNLESSCLMRAL